MHFFRTVLTVYLIAFAASSYAQSDTVALMHDQILVISDSLFIPKNDTIFIIERGTRYRIVNNKYALSTGFYDSVYQKARKNRFTRELFDLLIVSQPQQNTFTSDDPIRSESFFEGFEGKTITSIRYTSVDLFGGSVNDTTLKARSSIGKLSNDLHQSTEEQVIMKHLLFEKGDPVNSFLLADSERIIRSLKYIEDVKIVLSVDPEDMQSVKANIIVKDRFPWSADFTTDEQGAYRIGFVNRNILGTGNEFGVGFLHSREELPKNGYDAQYTIRNIKDSFIDGTEYTSNNYTGKSNGIVFKRDFLTPNIKYFGEARFELVQPISDLIFADSIYEVDFRLDRKSYDLWAGRAFLIGDRRTVNAAVRLQHDNFSRRPQVSLDSNTIYHDHHLLIGAISYSKLNFLKTRNVQAFNITEDIPIGFNYSILLGRDWTEFGPKVYRGIQANYAGYNNQWGYLLLNLEAGYFSRQTIRVNQVFQLDARHFTKLLEVGQAYARFFTRIHYFNGDNLSIPQSQSLAFENRLRNIEGLQIEGNRIATLTTEYVVFQPWYFYGFRFSTYGNLGIGNALETRNENPYNKTYYSLGGGIRIRNESLVINTFDFGISLFPNAPIAGRTFYFKLNLGTPQFFQGPQLRKPRVVGLN